MRYRRVPAIDLEAMDGLWAVFSPATGETSLLNDESVAILELLDVGPGNTASITLALAEGDEAEAASLAPVIESAWPRLIEAGLVRAEPVGPTIRQ